MALRQSQPPHTCYYSNKCEWSEAFLKELATTQYKGEFHFVCIDTTPRGQLPNWLKQVPTLLIKGAEEPIKVGSDVMNWLYERKMKDTSRAPASVVNAMKGPSSASLEPEAWNISEMGGKLSESYGSLVDGSGASVESSSSKNFDFGFLNGNAAPGDRTGQNMGNGMKVEPGRSKSKKEELFDKQMESYQQNRDTGMPQRRAAPI